MEHDMSVVGLFLQAGWIVKAVMIGLLMASVWSWAIIIDKVVSFGRMRKQLERFEENFWSGASLEELYRSLQDKKATGMGA
ncbi:MAG: protein TolQ, partial [Ahrensia sp.]